MKNFLEVHAEEPIGFVADIEVAACHVEVDGKLFLLRRGPKQSESCTWCVPAGKIERGETVRQAAVRELFEETNITIKESSLHTLGTFYVRKPHVAYVYHIFKVSLDTVLDVQLSDEHTEYQWTTSLDRENLPLIPGAKEILGLYYK